MPDIYLVEFKGHRKRFFLNPYYIKIREGEHVVVQGERGEDLGRATKKVEREDVNVVEIPAVEMAARLGDTQVSNFILLGVYAGATKVISPEFIKEEIERRFKGNERMLLLNSKAFEVGQGWLSRNRQAL